MKTNRQARLLLIRPFAPRKQTVNISKRKKLHYFGGVYYCINRKLNIGQARSVRYRKLYGSRVIFQRYRKWVKSPEEV